MKKEFIITMILIVIIVGGILLFINIRNKDNKIVLPNIEEPTNNNQELEVDNKEENSMRIKLSFNNKELYVILDDNETSKDFLSLLPLTLEFEDYNSTEKIAILPRKITIDNAPDGYTPEVGDFAYYAPWGNLSIFYKEFRYSNSLVKLGEFESGIDELTNMTGNFEMTIEIVD